jgi:hypothetical protein
VMQAYAFFTSCVLIFIIFFNSLWTTFNHLFIWLDPEVVAHDAYCDEGGLFKFSFWIARAIFFFGWMEFI